jgi:hypothetical protein
LTSTFDKVFVINLPERHDRYREMERELGKLGLSWDSPQVNRFAALRPPDVGEFPSVGARGCFLSHLGVLEQALRQGLSSVLVLEDDCNLIENASLHFERLSAALDNTRWDIFYGGARLVDRGDEEHDCAAPIYRLPPEQPVQLTHCMAFRGEALGQLPAYLRLLASRRQGHPEGGPMHVDGAYCWFRKTHPRIATYKAFPDIAYQRSSRTDIHELSLGDRLPVVRSVYAAGRKVLNLRRR